MAQKSLWAPWYLNEYKIKKLFSFLYIKLFEKYDNFTDYT